MRNHLSRAEQVLGRDGNEWLKEVAAFVLLWIELADDSRVDGVGGAEFRRVLALWIATGPHDWQTDWELIPKWANEPPTVGG